jgi:regulator of sigma E protease
MNIAVAILGLAILILIHEAGHFFVARAVGMSPRKFYVGFPPAIARVRRKGTEYGLGAIPLGGYVKIPGMHRPAPSDVDVHFGRAEHERPALKREGDELRELLAAGEMDAARDRLPRLEEEVTSVRLSEAATRSAERGLRELGDGLGADAYWRQTTWRKIAVIFAGPATNLAFAVALLAVVFMLGIPVDTTRTVDQVVTGTPAEQIGLQPGDRILAIGGREVEPREISQTIRESEGEPIAVSVERDGERLTLGPVAPEEVEGTFRLGFVLEAEFESAGPGRAVVLATEQTWMVTKAIGGSIAQIATGGSREDVASPIGITQASSQALDAGFRYYLQIMALISLSLALLNLLPLLPLDGGHIAFSVIEGVRRRAIGREVYERVSIVGIAIVLFLFAIGISNDIGRLSGG